MWVCDSAPCPGEGKPVSSAGKPPCLRTGVEWYASCQIACLGSAIDLVLQMSKAAGWEYYLGSTGA